MDFTEKFEVDVECPSCNGTGVYRGLAEGDGAGVVCSKCEGTGCYHFVYYYKPFTGRKVRDDVKRVYQTNPGIKIGEGNGYKLEDFGGMPYENFLNDEEFPKGSEDRLHTCPAWWNQIRGKEKPSWCTLGVGSMFSTCEHFKKKENCWHLYDIKK